MEAARGEDIDEAVKDLIGLIEDVGLYGGYRKMQKKECFNLVRRLKLLAPLLEEIGELHDQHGGGGYLAALAKALLSAKKLLKQCSSGSKIYLALENEAVMGSFHAVYDKLNQALDDMPYDELGVSVEVKEQVELMRMQLKRAKRRTDTQDIELAMDLMVVLSKNNADRNADTAILQRLADKLELRNIGDLRAETIAVRKLANKSRHNSDTIQQIEGLLEKFKQIVGVESSIAINSLGKTLEKCPSSLVPHEFLCPITLEIMSDPVIIATGQTYERESIQRWLDSNHRTCPKTGQILTHISLAPNYALRNLIIQWCEKHDIKLPEKNNTRGSDSLEISSLIRDLSSAHLDDQSRAIAQLRTLSKENPGNRMLIANSGAIPPLVWLLSCPNPRIQENAVTAILNLSLDESNKRVIAREGAIPSIIDILRNGTDAARENSAAALFSISTLDENKALVGALKGIPPLVDLLKNGTVRGKKDALTAIFNLLLHQPNKSRAVKAGVVPPLLALLEDNKNLGMVDEALSILRLLASHPEGRNQIGHMSFIKTVVEIMRTGTPKNKECATCVLLELGTKNSSCMLAALQFGVYEHLVEIVRSGTSRAQRKANSLLQHMSKSEHIP